MRNAILTTAILLLAAIPVWAVDEESEKKDPWVGKTRAEVVELLGEPQKVKKKNAKQGAQLTYKFLRIDPSAPGQLTTPLTMVPGVGIVAKPQQGPEGSTALEIHGTSFDEQGRPTSVGGFAPVETSSATYEPKIGRIVRDGPDARLPSGKVKLRLVLDDEGRVVEWSVSGKGK